MLIVIGNNVYTLINGEFKTHRNCYIHIFSETIGIYKITDSFKLNKPVISYNIPDIKSCEFITPADLILFPERFNSWGEHYFTLLVLINDINVIGKLTEC